ncbi:hypothetical protein VU07_00685 [Desulfobulbus sp. F4]|nr:hypothetical protein [Desulfobulbus sp. F4]
MMDSKRIEVSGCKNLTAGRNIRIGDLKVYINDDETDITEAFKAADNLFRSEVKADGIILRGKEEVVYSSQALFTSLMQIGLPLNAAIRIPFHITSTLSDMRDLDPDKVFSTSDIRVAVVNCIGGLVYEGYNDDNVNSENVNMWEAAYIRRYGNPGANYFLIVLDNEEEKPLSHRYLQEVVIPHLLKRVIGPEECNLLHKQFPCVFSSKQIERMSREIWRFVSVLNLYSIRYKTLINLLQDLILQPPHPWIVNKQTKDIVTEYNLERANHHIQFIRNPDNVSNPCLFNQSASECFMHLCAAILSQYGAFLGVNTCYGLRELRRFLSLKDKRQELWSCCKISQLERDLESISCSTDSLFNRLDRVKYNLDSRDNSEQKFHSLSKGARELAEIVIELCPRHPSTNALKNTLNSAATR